MTTGLKLVLGILSLQVIIACRTDIKGNAEYQLDLLFSETFNGEALAFVDISEDGNHFLTGDVVEKIRYWNLDSLESPVQSVFESELIALNFVGKNNQVFFANRVGETRLFDNRLNTILSEYKFPQPSRFSRISSDLKIITYGEFIYYRDRKKLSSSTVGHAEQSSLQLSQQSLIVTSGFHDERVVVRNSDGTILADWRLDNPVTTAGISPNGDFVVAGTENGDCFLWHVASGKPTQRCDSDQPAQIIHIDARSRYFILVMQDSVTAYQLAPFKKIFSAEIDRYIRSSYLAENNWLAVGTDEGTLELFDVAAGKRIGGLKLNKGKITAIDVNAAARLLLLGTYDGNISLYKVSQKSNR